MKKRRHIPIRWIRHLVKVQNGICAAKGCVTTIALGPPRNFIIEHRIPRAIGGSDALKNLELRCKACAHEKTYTKTMAGSDRQKIDKARNCRKKLRVRKRAPGARPPAPKRSWSKGRKMQGRGFEKKHRPMQKRAKQERRV